MVSVYSPGLLKAYVDGEHDSHLPGVTDYQLYYAILEAIHQDQGWTSGVTRLYYTLAQDYVYDDPYQNVIFLDNHDLDRIFSVLGEDLTKFKSAFSLLLTLRGIPMMYYGTEVLMTGGGGGGFAEGGRLDFPGGWPKDDDDKFREKDRTDDEQAAFIHVQTLAQYRKQNSVLQSGNLTQYIPEDGVYVFFRHNEEKTVMVIFNASAEALEVPTERYNDMLQGYSSALNILTGENMREARTVVSGGKEYASAGAAMT